MCCQTRNGGGKLLVEKVNKYLEDKGYKGILFCKESLLGFYSKYNWVSVPQERVRFSKEHSGVYTMVYRCQSIESLVYSDRMI